MKDYYQINEISRLYGIGADSLRYYEKIGILSPKRAENGYRLYSLKDIYKLNIIRDLRRLDFSMQQIKDYLDYQSVSNTLELLRDELEIINKQMEFLEQAQATISARRDALIDISTTRDNQFVIKQFPERRCLQLMVELTRDEEADFAIKKLHKKYENMLDALGNQQLGTIPKIDANMRACVNGKYATYSSIFFILEPGAEKYNFVIPTGSYLSVFYRGEYTHTPPVISAALDYARNNGLEVIGAPLELCHIDNRYTIRPEEYLTEIQIQITLPRENHSCG